MQAYHCYGLRMESEIELPLMESGGNSNAPPVSVRLGGFEAPRTDFHLPYDASGAVFGPYMGGLLVRVRNCVDFLVDESSIGIVGGESVDILGDLAVRVALGFVLQKRSMLAFHGAAASRKGRAVAIFGERGAGKSTTAIGLAGRGWGILCDDVVVVEPEGTVPRGACRARLNANSLERLGNRLSGLASRDHDGKFAVDPCITGDAAPLRTIFAVEAADTAEVEMREVRGYAKLSAVLPHIHSPMGIGEPGDRLRRAAEVIARVPLYRITRPAHRFALDELIDAIESVSPKEDR